MSQMKFQKSVIEQNRSNLFLFNNFQQSSPGCFWSELKMNLPPFLSCRLVLFYCAFHLHRHNTIFLVTGQPPYYLMDHFFDGPIIDICVNALSRSFFIVLCIQLFTLFIELAPLSGQSFVTGVNKFLLIDINLVIFTESLHYILQCLFRNSFL